MSDKAKNQEEVEATPTPEAGVARLRVKDSNKEYIQAEEADMIDVIVEIYNPEAAEDGSDLVLEEKRFTYPLTKSADEIQEDLKRVLDTFNADAVAAVTNADHEAAQKAADETIATIADLVIEPDAEKVHNNKEEAKAKESEE